MINRVRRSLKFYTQKYVALENESQESESQESETENKDYEYTSLESRDSYTENESTENESTENESTESQESEYYNETTQFYDVESQSQKTDTSSTETESEIVKVSKKRKLKEIETDEESESTKTKNIKTENTEIDIENTDNEIETNTNSSNDTDDDFIVNENHSHSHSDNENNTDNETSTSQDFTYTKEAFENFLLEFKDQPELVAEFKKVREYLLKKVPSFERILYDIENIEEKSSLVELCEVFFIMTPYTLEWLDLKNEINERFDELRHKQEYVKNLNETEKEQLNKSITILQNYHNTNQIEYQIASLNLDIKYKKTIYERYKYFITLEKTDDEYSKLKLWLERVLQIPFNKSHKVANIDMETLKNRLDDELYGMEKIKDHILVYTYNHLYTKKGHLNCLALKGPPGTGKTQIALSLSKILNIPFYQLSGQHLQDMDTITGHNYTYIGSHEGNIVSALISMKCDNGIIFIDEFEKIPFEKTLSLLLKILDPMQNTEFRDRYIGNIPIDLSKIWFILAMNEFPESKPLVDRMYILSIEDYTFREKVLILKNYIIPQILKELELEITLQDEIINYLVEYYRDKTGIRSLKNELLNIFYKIQFLKRFPNVKTSFNRKNISTRLQNNVMTLDMLSFFISDTQNENACSFMYV